MVILSLCYYIFRKPFYAKNLKKIVVGRCWSGGYIHRVLAVKKINEPSHTFFIGLFFQFYQTILAFGHEGGIGILAQLLPFFKNNPKTMKINVRIILITGQTILMIFIIFHAISWPKRQKHSHLSVIIFVFKTLTGRTSWRFIKKRGI